MWTGMARKNLTLAAGIFAPPGPRRSPLEILSPSIAEAPASTTIWSPTVSLPAPNNSARRPTRSYTAESAGGVVWSVSVSISSAIQASMAPEAWGFSHGTLHPAAAAARIATRYPSRPLIAALFYHRPGAGAIGRWNRKRRGKTGRGTTSEATGAERGRRHRARKQRPPAVQGA